MKHEPKVIYSAEGYTRWADQCKCGNVWPCIDAYSASAGPLVQLARDSMKLRGESRCSVIYVYVPCDLGYAMAFAWGMRTAASLDDIYARVATAMRLPLRYLTGDGLPEVSDAENRAAFEFFGMRYSK